MNKDTQKTCSRQIALNISHFGKLIPKTINRTTRNDFKDNYTSIMSAFSCRCSVLEAECIVNKTSDIEVDIISAIDTSISYLFGSLSCDPLHIDKCINSIYSKNLLLPTNTEYKTFHDYVTLILKASLLYNKKLGFNVNQQ